MSALMNTGTFRVVVPQGETLGTLAASGSLPLLVSQACSELGVIKSVVASFVDRDSVTMKFFDENQARIHMVRTSICEEDEAKMRRGELLGPGRTRLAIADFYMHCIDDVVGTAPKIVIENVCRLSRDVERGDFPGNVRFISITQFPASPRKRGEQVGERDFHLSDFQVPINSAHLADKRLLGGGLRVVVFAAKYGTRHERICFSRLRRRLAPPPLARFAA